MKEISTVVTPASDADYEFSFRVKKVAEGDLVRRYFGWDETVQRDFHMKEWTERRPDIIWSCGVRVGTVAVRESGDCIEIGQFFILPEFQNRGLGTVILQEAVQRADERGLVARLAFLNGNRAESLYVRHGFALVAQTETHSFMERKPRPARLISLFRSSSWMWRRR